MISFVKANMLDAFKDVQIQSFKSSVESSTTSQTNSSTDSESISLLDALIKKFAKSFSNDAQPDENSENEAKYITSLVDENKNGTISLDELKTFDSSDVSAETKSIIKDLEVNFNTYDKDLSGELSLAEVQNAIGKKQYSIQELSAMAKEFKYGNQDDAASDEPSSSVFQAALDTYKSVDSNFVKQSN